MRTVALVFAAIGTLVEAVALGGVLYALGELIGAYQMSMNGMPYRHGQVALWVLGGVLAVVLAALSVVLAVTAVRGRPFGRFGRTLIVTALVLQGILGLVALITAPPTALIGVLFVFCCLLFGLLAQPATRGMHAQHSAG
jgi:hypothetical protein